MKIRFRGHNYNTQIAYVIKSHLPYTGAGYKWPKSNLILSHGQGCCNYWTPISAPEAQRALMNDDELGLSND